MERSSAGQLVYVMPASKPRRFDTRVISGRHQKVISATMVAARRVVNVMIEGNCTRIPVRGVRWRILFSNTPLKNSALPCIERLLPPGFFGGRRCRRRMRGANARQAMFSRESLIDRSGFLPSCRPPRAGKHPLIRLRHLLPHKKAWGRRRSIENVVCTTPDCEKCG